MAGTRLDCAIFKDAELTGATWPCAGFDPMSTGVRRHPQDMWELSERMRQRITP